MTGAHWFIFLVGAFFGSFATILLWTWANRVADRREQQKYLHDSEGWCE